MKTYVDVQYNFMEAFDSDTGFYARSGVIENGKDTGVDPFMRSYPGLIDIGIMGSCQHARTGQCLRAGVQCYQGGSTVVQPDMPLADYKRVIDQSRGKTMQVALGGRGDPNLHADFEAVLAYTRENGIVPNYTTSGMLLSDEQIALSKEYCGAVAVSWYGADYTVTALRRLIDAGVTTNVHYVLNKSTIEQAGDMLADEDSLPSGLNAVIFLLHKPVGLGKQEEVLSFDMPAVREFFYLVEHGHFPYKLGFDACSIPGIATQAPSLDSTYFDSCEGGRYSMYISPGMIATPCSFDQGFEYGYKLGNIEDAWNSPQFEAFRNILRNACPACPIRDVCMGGCPLHPEIVLCGQIHCAGFAGFH